MYLVKYGKEYLHDPRTNDCVLLDLTLTCEENSCGYCDFTIYPSHPMYGKLKERDSDNLILVYDDDILLFSGFIYDLGKEFYLDGQVKCKGELDYLRESIIRPYSTLAGGYRELAPSTIYGYFSWLITQHNSQVSPNKQFKMGYNQGSNLGADEAIYVENDNYPTTIDEISENLLNNVGGYIRARREPDGLYIDYLSEWSDVNAQILDFGVNLTNYSQNDNSADIATFVVPLGASLGETDYDYDDGYYPTEDKTPIAGKEYYTVEDDFYGYVGLSSFDYGITYYEIKDDAYVVTSDKIPDPNKGYYIRRGIYSYCSEDMTVFEDGVTYFEYYDTLDESNLPLTIKGYPVNYFNDTDYINKDDMLYSTEGVEKYGWIGLTYRDTDITSKEELLIWAMVQLKSNVSPKRTIEIKAVDMHLINPDIKPIRIGEYVRVRSRPHDLDSYFLCRNIDLDLNNPERSTYTLGTAYDTLTGEQSKRVKQLNSEINKQYDAVAAISEEAINAAVNAGEIAIKAEETAKKAEETADSAIKVVYEEYAASASPTEPPTGDWVTMPPENSDDMFIWRRIVVTYGDGTIIRGEPVLISGGSGKDGQDAVLLRIESSRGTVFKNNSMNTVLTVVIYKGSQRITDLTKLHSTFGSKAYLQWYWQKIDDSSFGVISVDDSMLSNDGFALTISADKVDTKVTFMCELII